MVFFFKFTLCDHFEVHSILNILARTFIGYLGLSHNLLSKEFVNVLHLQVRNSVESGNIEMILDPLVQTSNATHDAVWKVVDVALRSVEPKSVHRPTMREVVDELRQAVTMANVLPPNLQKMSHHNTPSNLSNFSSDSHNEPQTDSIPPR